MRLLYCALLALNLWNVQYTMGEQVEEVYAEVDHVYDDIFASASADSISSRNVLAVMWFFLPEEGGLKQLKQVKKQGFEEKFGVSVETVWKEVNFDPHNPQGYLDTLATKVKLALEAVNRLVVDIPSLEKQHPDRAERVKGLAYSLLYLNERAYANVPTRYQEPGLAVQLKQAINNLLAHYPELRERTQELQEAQHDPLALFDEINENLQVIVEDPWYYPGKITYMLTGALITGFVGFLILKTQEYGPRAVPGGDSRMSLRGNSPQTNFFSPVGWARTVGRGLAR